MGGVQWLGPAIVLVVGLIILSLVAAVGAWLKTRRSVKGLASRRHIRNALTIAARRRELPTIRPSLPRHPAPASTECGIYIGRAAHTGQPLWASFEDVVGLVAPPRAGKTGTLAGSIVDAPGAVVVTSTRADIYETTYRARASTGPLEVFNPDDLGGDVLSTFRWNLVRGCEDPVVASRRAGYLLSGSEATKGVEGRDFWKGNNYRVLRSYLFAAAVSGSDLLTVVAWITDPSDSRPLAILRAEPSTPPSWALEMEQVLTHSPQKTLESIFLTLSLTFSFMGNPAAAQAVTPPLGSAQFDVDRFIMQRGTLYLLGEEHEYTSLAPLFTCLTSEVYERATWLASRAPTGRLDPPLLLALDEVATICPVPLDRWTSTAGGWGVPIAYAVQSPAQLYDRWGRYGAEAIWNNTTVVVVLGGLSNSQYLDDLSKLCGEREQPVVTTAKGGHRSSTPQRVPVLSPADIRMLPRWEALVIHRNTPPIRATLTPIWARKP